MLAKLLLVISCTLALVNSRGTCPSGWTKWKDEKCYLLTTTYSNFAAAQETCKSLGASLANVKEEEQQTFLTNYIFKISEVEIGVWIGGSRAGGSKREFQWEDGTPFQYAYWGVGSPTKLDRRNCVALQSKYSDKMEIHGTWKDTSCNTPLYLVCEREPEWGLDDIKMILIETRKKLDKTSQQLEEQIKNPVPVGYIYTQFPQQPLPSTIWPNVKWTEVTSQFAGQFFRAAGGNAATFGQTQQGNSPRLIQVNTVTASIPPKYLAEVVPGSWTIDIESGDYTYDGSRTHKALRFLVSNTEVRPTNTAIRIWKRSA